MSDAPLIAPSPLRRVLLRTALFVAVIELVCAGFLFTEGGKVRLALLFGLGMAIPTALVAAVELGLRSRGPSIPRAVAALFLAWIVGAIGVLLALCQAAYADASLGGGDPGAGLAAAKEMLGRLLDHGPWFVFAIAVPFGPATAARVGLRRLWMQALVCLAASPPVGYLLLQGGSRGDRAFAFMLCLAGALVLPPFGAAADRVERWLWPPEPEPVDEAIQQAG